MSTEFRVSSSATAHLRFHILNDALVAERVQVQEPLERFLQARMDHHTVAGTVPEIDPAHILPALQHVVLLHRVHADAVDFVAGIGLIFHASIFGLFSQTLCLVKEHSLSVGHLFGEGALAKHGQR